jgi:hypothetical protein
MRRSNKGKTTCTEGGWAMTPVLSLVRLRGVVSRVLHDKNLSKKSKTEQGLDISQRSHNEQRSKGI